jgi:hypothetical protein
VAADARFTTGQLPEKVDAVRLYTIRLALFTHISEVRERRGYQSTSNINATDIVINKRIAGELRGEN